MCENCEEKVEKKIDKRKKYTIEDCSRIAKEKHDGKCLSTVFIQSHDKNLKWECCLGHVFNLSLDSVIQNRWCQECYNIRRKEKRKYSIEFCHELAKKKHGKLISDKYINTKEYLEWECECGFQFKSSLDNILHNGSWCPKCGGTLKLTLQECIDFAENKGGKCNSLEYINSKYLMDWECDKGHKWKAKFGDIKDGKWCPKCNILYCENCCIESFENLLGVKFVKCRPSWLINPITSRKLELDGYCEQLKIAIEYNGPSHYEKVCKFKMSDEALKSQQYRDKVKVILCKQNNIDLFVIKHPKIIINNRIVLKDMIFNLVKEELIKRGYI